MRWLVADTLACPEQWFGSHLSAYSHYLREFGETVESYCLNIPYGEWTVHEGDALRRPDVIFALDRYDRCARWSFDNTTATEKTVKLVAQVAAVTNPLPWNVRKPDGSPSYDLIVSSIPAMVEQARAAGCRAEFQRLCFDTRARACGMGVKREKEAIFIGTQGVNHRRRGELLRELSDIVEVVPPVFGRDYYRRIAGATVLVQIHAEWARGCANSLKMYEGPGMGTAIVADGRLQVGSSDMWGWRADDAAIARESIEEALSDRAAEDRAHDEARVLSRETYECADRVPQLIEWAKEI